MLSKINTTLAKSQASINRACNSVKTRTESWVSPTTVQAGLTNIMDTLKPVKPFVLAKLIRSIIDSETIERLTYNIICLFDLYSEYLPALSHVSTEAFQALWDFIKYLRTEYTKRAEASAQEALDEQLEELEPQGFVKIDQAENNVPAEKLATSFGLNFEDIKKNFTNLELPVAILSGLLGLAAIFCGDKIAALLIDPKVLKNSLATTAKLIKDTNVIWSTFSSTWESIMSFIGNLFGYTYLNEKDEKTKTIMLRISELRERFSKLKDTIMTDLASIVQSEKGLIDLERDIKSLEKEIDSINSENIKTNFNLYMQGFQRNLDKAKEVIYDTKASAAGKQEPTIIYLSGPRGVGKSKLALNIIKQLGIKEGRPLSVYPRNSVADKFWSKYRHQDVVTYDDFGQDKNNLDHSEMFGIGTPGAYYLNLADSPDKGSPFTSRYVILNSNQDYITQSKTVMDIDALNRRRGWLYRVNAPDCEAYREQNGSMPPPDSDMWRADFTHLRIQRWMPENMTSMTNWDEAKILSNNVTIAEIVDEAYKRQLFHQEQYRKEVEEALAAPERIRQIIAEQEQQRIDLFEELPDFDIQIQELEPHGIAKVVEGINLYLIQGPSRCGKSHLLKELLFKKVHTLEEIMERDGTLKIHHKTNLHIEDISISEAHLSNALEIAQRLSDHDEYDGICVFSANTDMLAKLLANKGDEAQEVFYERMKVITIERLPTVKRVQRYNDVSALWTKYNAKDLGRVSGLTWDSIYCGYYKGKEIKFMDIQLLIHKNEKTIRLVATFDQETLEDFDPTKATVIHFPSISWDEFQLMEDYSQLRYKCTAASILKATMTLRDYLPALHAIPRSFEHPTQLVNIVNKSQIRISPTAPSVELRFSDFSLLMINHKTFLQMQIKTSTGSFPNFEWQNPELVPVPERENMWSMMTQLVTLVFGGTLIARELFGNNQTPFFHVPHTPTIKGLTKRPALKVAENPEKTIKFLIYAPSGNGKTTWKDSSSLGPLFDDTDDGFGEDDFVISNDEALIPYAQYGVIFVPSYDLICKRHFAFSTSKEFDLPEQIEEYLNHPDNSKDLVFKHLSAPNEYVKTYSKLIATEFIKRFPEYKPQLASIKEESKKKRLVARSRAIKPRVVDKSAGAATTRHQTQTLQNEATRRRVVNYDMQPKHEATRVLTHTDLQPRYTLPEYKNILDIQPDSHYHPNHYKNLIHLIKENNLTIAMETFEKILQGKNLDTSVFHQELHFAGLSQEDTDLWISFLKMWQQQHLQPESMSDSQAAQLIPILQKNQVYVLNGGTITQRALMIHDHIGVTTDHGIDENCTIQVPKTGQNFPITIVNSSADKDLCIFRIHKTCQAFPDIRKFIRSRKDTDILDGCDAFFLTNHGIKDKLITIIRASKIETRKEIRYLQRVREGYYYGGTVTGFDLPLPALTEKGHCGCPGVILNTRYQRKIISIHSAGSDTCAFGLPIYREMFEPQTLNPQAIEVPDIKVLPHQELTPIEPFKIGEFTALYELQHNNSAPSKTDIYRSPLQSDHFGDNFEPAILANYDSRNTDAVDISHVTIEKWAKKQPENLDEELLDQCVDEWANFYRQLIVKEQKKQFKLTKTEAINRTTYYPSSQPLPRDTSAGYPWKHRPGSKGKHLFIQPREHTNTILNCLTADKNGQDLNQAIDALVNTCRQGKRPAVVFSSSAKDEVLKKKKIYPCRTRGFAGAPLDFSIAHRQYFHTAICSLIELRHKNPIKVGIEANGQEWNDLYHWLADNSTVGFDADFKDWDATIPKKIMEKLHIIYNAIYTACPQNPESLEEDNTVRKWLHSVLWGPLLTLNQHVVQAPGGQVSGQPATTIDNCLVGLIVLTYAWMKLAPEEHRNFSAFLDMVRIAVYGDDQVVTVKPEALSFFNLESVATLIKDQIGMEITPASKDGKIIQFKPLEEMEFLKRNFLKIGPYYYGKLQPSVFDKMLNWTHTYKKHHFFREPTRVHYEPTTIDASIESMLYELCIYPPETYTAIVDHCTKVLSKIGSKKHLPTQTSMLMQRGVPHRTFLSTFKQT